MRRKILFVLGSYTYGGTIFSTFNMLSFLKSHYDIYILALSPYGPIKEMYDQYNKLQTSPRLKAYSNSRTGNEDSLWQRILLVCHKIVSHLFLSFGYDISDYIFRMEAKRIAEHYSFDVVASTQEGISTRFVSLYDAPLRVAWFRSEYSVYMHQLTPKQQKDEQEIYRRFQKIVCVSKTTRDDFCKYFDDISDKVFAIHNIQNVEQIVKKSLEPVPDQFQLDTFNIVSVGRIAKQKQFCLIPRIAYELKNRYGLDFRWYIIGDGNVLGEAERLQSELEKYGNSDYVICMGSRINPYPYIASANLLVNTSYYEACPRVVAEAQILHTPVVCADFSSASEFVESNINGFVCTTEKLTATIAKLIIDQTLYNTIKLNCNSYQIDNSKIFEKLVSVFE